MKARFGKRWSFYPWFRHWHVEVRVMGWWFIVGFNARRDLTGRRLMPCLYASPDATPSHERAIGLGVHPRR